MKRNHYKTFWFLFKLTLLFNVYFHHKVTAVSSTISKELNPGLEETENVFDRKERPARLLPLKYSLGKRINQTENDQYDARFHGLASNCEKLLKIGYTLNGFYLVKEQTELNKSQIEVVGCKFKNPQGFKEVKEERFGLVSLPAREGDLERIKRPGRLLPLQLLYGKEANETENKIISEKYFYGPATNCKELSILGYTLNGFYLVRSKDKSKNAIIEIISCQFKHNSGLKEAMEERFGSITLEVDVIKSNQSKMKGLAKLLETSMIEHKLSRRPGRLIPPKLLFGKEKNKTGNGNKMELQFYGPAKNCKELGILGYTLNGFYLVNGKDKSDTIGMEVVFCRFKLPKGFRESLKEERCGFVAMHRDFIEGVWSHQASVANQIEKSHCNPIGYFKNEDDDMCIHADTIKLDCVKRRRCNERSEQQWAINGSHICHPIKDKCFTFANQGSIYRVVLHPYNASDEYQKWKYIEETSQIAGNIEMGKERSLCMQISSKNPDGLACLPFFETLLCNQSNWAQQWTFTPVITADNHQKCANYDERGAGGGAFHHVNKEERLEPVIKNVGVATSQLGTKNGSPTTKSLGSKNFGHSAVKETGSSNCNPVGYWKNEERNVCLSYDDAFAGGTILIPRRCKGGIEQKWATNKTFICHPTKDKCLTYIYAFNKEMVSLTPYTGNEVQKWKWNKEDNITQISTIKNSCLEDVDNLILGSAFIELLECDQNKKSQKWSFIPITDANNRLECANFSERPSKRLK